MSDEHWSDPGAYPVADGVHRIPLPLPMDGLKAVNIYVLETEDGITCIDGGWAIEVARKQFEESLKSIGHHPRDITSFLVTHAHRDHYTQAAALRTEFGRATVALGRNDQPTLDLILSDEIDNDPFSIRLRACGAHDIAKEWEEWARNSAPDREVWAYPDTWLESDHTITVGSRRLSAVATPGHTAGHFVFADLAADVLFGGDHVLPTITPSVGFEVIPDARPLRDFLASLEKVRAMPDLQLLPAHGATDRRTHERVAELIEHHDQRLELCVDAIRAGLHTPYDVARVLPWTRHERHFDELDVFNQGMAVMETMVHLDLLLLRGQLVLDDANGTMIYAVVSQT